uniref:TRASH domain-containing protein n=1 Tax=Periophthalmus magnuspinnatus TaxID=409849 RepID=A0A3B4BMJ5_9GOBI
KEEPIDEEYDAALLPQNSIKDIKEELEQEVMAPGPVRAPAPVLNTVPAAPTMPPRLPPPPTVAGGVRCSGCSKVLLLYCIVNIILSLINAFCCIYYGELLCVQILMKGQTAFQRKGSTQLFCSTVCLTGHLPLVTKSRTCFQCYKEIANPREMVTISAENNTLMNFCGQFCLSVYRSKKKKTETDKFLDKKQTKLPEKPLCSVCKLPNKIEHEVNHQGSLYKLCSDACFVSWRKMKQLALNCCEGCGLYCNSNSGSCQTLMVDKSELNFCGPTCISTYKQVWIFVAVVSSTVMEVDQKGKVQLYCSTLCVEKNTAFPCSHCRVSAVPQYHLAMVDGTIRNFCSLDCVTTYRKSKHTNLPNGTSVPKELPIKDGPNPTSSRESISTSKDTSSLNMNHPHQPPIVPPAPALHKSEIPPVIEPDQNLTKSDLHKVQLSCENCKNLFRSKPHLNLCYFLQGSISIFCSNACSFEYKTQKNIVAFCRYCKNEKVLYEKISHNEEDVSFCSENCKQLFQQSFLDNPCSYCSRFSSKNVQSHYCGQMKGFCKPYCMSKYTVRYYGMARCDNCRKQGYMTENLQCMGSVRNFCNLPCLLHYCHLHFDKGTHSLSNGTSPVPLRLNGNFECATHTRLVSVLCGHIMLTDPNRNLNQTDSTVGPHVPMSRRRPMKNKTILCRPITMDQEISCQLLCPSDSPGNYNRR